MTRGYVLEAEQWLPRPLEEVFAFFSDATNLAVLTPPEVAFRITSAQPIDMHAGTRIDYRLRLLGLPLRWRSVISVWEPPDRFVDDQLRGPYRRWVHEHCFAAEREGTRVRDRVEYSVAGGALVHRLFVARNLRRIFAYRAERLAAHFGAHDPGRLSIGPLAMADRTHR